MTSPTSSRQSLVPNELGGKQLWLLPAFSTRLLDSADLNHLTRRITQMANRKGDPVISFQFSLELNGMTGYFTEVTGILSESPVATHKVVNDAAKEVTLQLPGRTDGDQMTFKRGLTSNREFWEWRQLVI